MRRFFMLLVPAALAGCVTDAVEPQPAESCAAATFPADRFIGPSFTDKFLGRYWNGSRAMDVTSESGRMYVAAAGGDRRQVQRINEALFHDGCGTAYHFILPTHGPGGRLTVTDSTGSAIEWQRRGQ